jgi:hypothetical protein
MNAPFRKENAMKRLEFVLGVRAPIRLRSFEQLSAFALLLSCVGVSCAQASNIVGKVLVGSTGLANSVVYLEGVHGTFPPPAQRAILNQRDKSFVPHVMAVMKGTTVELLNSDDFLHNTFSDSKAKTFNLNQPVKDSRSLVKTDQAGVIEVRCHIHGSMQAWIVVVDNPYFAVTDARGIFRIAGVPPGNYKMKTWSEQHGILTDEVKVAEKDGATVIVKYAAK